MLSRQKAKLAEDRARSARPASRPALPPAGSTGRRPGAQGRIDAAARGTSSSDVRTGNPGMRPARPNSRTQADGQPLPNSQRYGRNIPQDGANYFRAVTQGPTLKGTKPAPTKGGALVKSTPGALAKNGGRFARLLGTAGSVAGAGLTAFAIPGQAIDAFNFNDPNTSAGRTRASFDRLTRSKTGQAGPNSGGGPKGTNKPSANGPNGLPMGDIRGGGGDVPGNNPGPKGTNRRPVRSSGSPTAVREAPSAPQLPPAAPAPSPAPRQSAPPSAPPARPSAAPSSAPAARRSGGSGGSRPSAASSPRSTSSSPRSAPASAPKAPPAAAKPTPKAPAPTTPAEPNLFNAPRTGVPKFRTDMNPLGKKIVGTTNFSKSVPSERAFDTTSDYSSSLSIPDKKKRKS
jgi:hypothetical protein